MIRSAVLARIADTQGALANLFTAEQAIMPPHDIDFEVELARHETASCHYLTHLDNAGAALPPDCVTDAFIAALQQEASIGSYRSARIQKEAIDQTYVALAQLLNCDPSEIALVESGSRAWDLPFSMISLAAGSVIITSEYEYANNYITMLRAAKRCNCRIEFVRLNESGDICLHHLSELIDRWGHQVRVISITHVPTHNSIVNPVEKIGELVSRAKASGALADTSIYAVDACQSVGQLPVDVQKIKCDVLTLCSRKFLRGPRGLAAIYFRKKTLEQEVSLHCAEPSLLNIPGFTWVQEHRYEMRRDGRCFESWESNYSAKIAFGRALEYYATKDPSILHRYIAALATHLRRILRDVRGISVTDVGEKKSALVTFSVNAQPPQQIARELEAENFNISVIDRRTAHINMNKKQQQHVLRASVHYYNTCEEVEKFAEIVDRSVRYAQ
jgi:cysteine desulfurase/selenocysteine lyase